MENDIEKVYYRKIAASREFVWRRGEWFWSFQVEIYRRVDCQFKWIGFRKTTYPYCGPGTWTRYFDFTLFNHDFSFCLSRGRYDGSTKCHGG